MEPGDAAGAAESVASALSERPAEIVLLLGEGPAAVAAATGALRARSVLVRVGAGRRDGPHADAARAVDRLAPVLLVHDEGARRALALEGAAGLLIDVGPVGEEATGERIVRALARARRVPPAGSPGAGTPGGN